MKLNLEFRDSIPSNVTPLDAVAIVKCLDEKGAVTWYNISTEDLNLMELFGMLHSAVIITENAVQLGFVADPDDDDESQ